MPQMFNHGGRDAWVGAGNPNANHGSVPHLRLSSGGQYGLMRLQYTVPKGATLTPTYLELRARGSIPAQTITVTRLADAFRERDVTWPGPGVTGAAASVTIPALSDGDLIQIDVTAHVRSVASGAPNYGWRIETDDTSGTTQVYALEAGQYQPRLNLNYADKPGVPTDIVPSDGAVVSDPAPTITYSYSDVTGEGMAAQRVMCDPAGNFTAPAFDSGWVDATEPEFDLSASTFTPMTEGQTMQAQITVRGLDGGESKPSDVVEWTYKAQTVITPSSPSTATPKVFEPTPDITFQVDKSASAYQVRITRADDHSHVLYNSHEVPANGATTIGHTIPKKWRGNRVLKDDKTYALNIRAWDQETARQATTGHPLFGHVWLDFTADTDATVTAPTGLTAEQDGSTPWVILTWDAASAPDSFVVRMDGHVVESGILPQDVLVSGTQYQWRYHGASPNVAHDFTVRAVVNHNSSPDSNTATVTTRPAGLWLIDFDRDQSFDLGGVGVDSWQMADQVGVYRLLDGSQIQVHTGMGGLEGRFDGVLSRVVPGRTVAQLESDLYSIKEQPERTLQLIAGDFSIPVKVRNLKDGPHPESQPGRPWRLVSFDFFQDGDLPFDVRL